MPLSVPPSPDISAFSNRLTKTAAHWKKWAKRRGITCFRIYDRDVPQFPFAIDWFETAGPDAAVHLHVQEIDTGWKLADEDYTAWLVAVCDAICAICGITEERLHLKRRERQRGIAQYEKLEGRAEVLVVEEAGHRFEINLDGYLDTGLFLDHRQTRALVAQAIAAKKQAAFLNLFAYTGSFSVYAALAGAAKSVTVDLSNTYQAWSLRNFALNGIDPKRHALVRADVFTWLREADEQGQRFDVIVLDPPSFSNSKKMAGVLDVQRDHVWLIRQCHAMLYDGGALFFSTNLRSFEMDKQLATRLLLKEISHQTVPDDFKRPSHALPHRAWHCTK